MLIDCFEIDKSRHIQTRGIVNNDIGLDNVTLSVMSQMELISGTFNKAELKLLNKNIFRFNILYINQQISSIALSLLEEYNLSHNLAIPDAIIAATAIYADLQLFTYNQKDFRFIKVLKLYNI